MRKNILYIALLFYSFTHAQNVELLKQATNCDLSQATDFANTLAKNFRVEYELLDSRVSKRGGVYNIIYVPVSLSAQEKKDIKNSIEISYTREFECEKCLSVHFNIFNEGGNADLEIEGITKYRFTFVKGKFLDLFNFWVKNVNPNAVAEEISNKSIDSQRDFKNNQYWYNFARNNNEDKWYIKNYTDRLNEFK